MACLLNASGFSQTLRSRWAHRNVKRYTEAKNTSNYYTKRESKHTPRSPTKILKKSHVYPCLVYLNTYMKTHKNEPQIVGKAGTHESRRFGSSSFNLGQTPLTFGHEGVLQHLGGVDVSHPILSNMCKYMYIYIYTLHLK